VFQISKGAGRHDHDFFRRRQLLISKLRITDFGCSPRDEQSGADTWCRWARVKRSTLKGSPRRLPRTASFSRNERCRARNRLLSQLSLHIAHPTNSDGPAASRLLVFEFQRRLHADWTSGNDSLMPARNIILRWGLRRRHLHHQQSTDLVISKSGGRKRYSHLWVTTYALATTNRSRT